MEPDPEMLSQGTEDLRLYRNKVEIVYGGGYGGKISVLRSFPIGEEAYRDMGDFQIGDGWEPGGPVPDVPFDYQRRKLFTSVLNHPNDIKQVRKLLFQQFRNFQKSD